MKRVILGLVVLSVCLPFEGRAWISWVSGSADREDAASAVAVDSQGNVIAAGFIANTGTGPDFAVVKFDGNTGRELWRAVINGTANQQDIAHSVTVDAEDHVIAAGETTNTGGRSFTVIKLAKQTGRELWRAVLNGVARKVVVDQDGNVVAAGEISSHMDGVGDFAVIKFDGQTGRELARGVADYGDALAVAIDGQGNIAAAGSGYATNFMVNKFNGDTGERQWRWAAITSCFVSGQALAVAADARSDIVVAGRTDTRSPIDVPSSSRFTLIKFRGESGRPVWTQHIQGTGEAAARSVAVNTEGNFIVAGHTTRSLVLKFNGEDGRQLWASETTYGTEKAISDGLDDVIAISRSGFLVLKLAGATGQELWRSGTTESRFRAADVTVDGQADVIAVGQIGRFAVLKLRGKDGADF